MIIILAAGLLFFGGKKLPELAKGLGRAMGEFQRGRMEVEREINKAYQAEAAAPKASVELPSPKTPSATKVDASGPDDFERPESKVVMAARALGIQTEGKTEEELKREIAKIAGS